jgi:copper chaperone CopZ
MSQKETVLDVVGMSCASCVRHVSAALQSVPGVSSVEVRLRAGTVLVRHDATASTSSMVEALDEAGYASRIEVGPLQAEVMAPQRRG